MEGEESRCIGCLLGAWVGDAFGGVLEFGGVPSAGAVQNAWTMPGGGVHRLGPGQVTDDSEMGLSLLRGLLAGQGSLDLNHIATWYGKWFASHPFDVGNTIRQSVGKAVNMTQHQAEMMRRGAAKAGESQSNGCLMRIAPLAVFLRRLSREEVDVAVREEVGLTHINATVQWACVLYCLAVGALIREAGNRAAAWTYARDYVLQVGNPEIRTWISAVETPTEEVVVNRQSGWAKIAIVHGFRSLLGGLSYRQGLEAVVSQGGDTDTNACIIGGLLGAADGQEAVPAPSASAVLAFSPKTNGGIMRPSWLQPSSVYPLIPQFLALSPARLTIVGGREEYTKKAENQRGNG